MSRGFIDYGELGFFPLQDHANDNVRVSVRQAMAAGRVSKLKTAYDTDTPSEAITEYAKDNGMGTLGDVHPWIFWQTRDRAVRGNGSWAQVFGTMLTQGADRYHNASAQPIHDGEFHNDTRYAAKGLRWPKGFSTLPKGVMLIALPATEESKQLELAFWADGRLVCPNIEGPGEAGTLVVDLQPANEMCMANQDTPGIGGRHARLQTVFRVIANGRQPMAGLGAPGNVVALNHSTTGSDGIPGYGAIWTELVAGGPTTGGGGLPPPVTPGPPGTGTATLGGGRTLDNGFQTERSNLGSINTGGGTFGSSTATTAGDEEKVPKGFGTFTPTPIFRKGVALMAARTAYGPIHGGADGDKHEHGVDADGNPINAAHISTGAYFFRDVERDGPLLFEGAYPFPPSWPLTSRVHLSWDRSAQHAFRGGVRSGIWRWWAEVPYIAPHDQPPTVPPVTPPTSPPVTPNRPPGPPPPPNPPPVQRPPNPPTTRPGAPPPPTPPVTGGPGNPAPPTLPPVVPPPPPPPPRGPIRPHIPWDPATGGPSGPSDPPGYPPKPPRGPVRPGGEPWEGWPIGVYPPTSYDYRPFSGLNHAEDPARRSAGEGPRPVIGIGSDIPSRDSTPDPNDPYELTGGAADAQRGLGEVAPIAPGFRYGSAGAGGPGGMGTRGMDPRVSMGLISGQNPWSREPSRVPGLIERVGTASGVVAAYSIFHPMQEGFAAVAFRPQLTVKGYPNFEHNPQAPASLIRNDEITRPQVLVARAWGAQNNSGDWAYTQKPATSRARGGTSVGGVVFGPPRFELSDYFGVGSQANVEDVTSAVATRSYVMVAPGVSLALGTPTNTGGIAAKGITIEQDVSVATKALLVKHDSAEIVRGYKSGTEVVVELAQGGTTAIKIPVGTTAQRPASPLDGHIRINTSGANRAFEFYDSISASWVQPTAGGGGGGYATVQEEGSNLTARTKLNFIGPNVTAADDAGNTRTNVTVSGTLIRAPQVLASGTTYTTPAGCNSIYAELIGAGGGGGGAAQTASKASVGGGGASGAYCAGYLAVTPSTGYTIAIGTGGTAGASSGGTGGTGNDTTLTVGGTTFTAKGGLGGVGMAASTLAVALGGAGQTSTSGDINGTGAAGESATLLSGTVGVSGAGASTAWGGGGAARSTEGAGNDGHVYGAGGGGGACFGTTARAGGAGANGVIRVWEFA